MVLLGRKEVSIIPPFMYLFFFFFAMLTISERINIPPGIRTRGLQSFD